MTHHPAKIYWYRLLSQSRQLSQGGFTLLEILTSLIISSIVVSGLLFLTVDLLKTDQRETVLEQTQKNMKRGLDYIADDLREAVFVYTDPAAVVNQATGVTDFPANAVPVLAFWRLDPVDTSALPSNCDSLSTPAQKDECKVLKIRQAAYTLVVYGQINNTSSTVWEGQSRLVRYELRKYQTISSTGLVQRPGYLDPSRPGFSFETWTRQILNPNVDPVTYVSETSGQSSVLVDYLDTATTTTVTANQPDCRFLTGEQPTPGSALPTAYVLLPSNADKSTSFFACIRDTVPITGTTAGVINRAGQDAFLFIRGNANPSNGGPSPVLGGISESSKLPRLQTQVLVRGVIEKAPSE